MRIVVQADTEEEALEISDRELLDGDVVKREVLTDTEYRKHFVEMFDGPIEALANLTIIK
jgi:hypothetical protein